MASATVKNGTSEIVVVKVKLLAVKPMLSSRKRLRKVIAVSRQGKWDRSAESCFKVMTGIMPLA